MDKKRCHNFTTTEVDVLVTLVEKYKDIVECKRTDTVTNGGKEEQWRKMEVSFNAICGSGRTAKMLRSKWDSLKKSTKKDYAQLKQHLYRTGGGPAVENKLGGIGDRILAIVGVGVTGTQSKFNSDCDRWEPVTDESVILTQQSHNEEMVEVCGIEATPRIPDGENSVEIIELPHCSWQSWTPQQLRQPKSKQLQVLEVPDDTFMDNQETKKEMETPKGLVDNSKRKRFYKRDPIPKKIKQQTTYDELARKKIEFIDFQMALLKKEAEKKEERLAEKHELEMKILNCDLKKKQNNL